MTIRWIASLWVILGTAAIGQTEFIVNTRQDSTQRDPQIERDAAGNFVVVWNSHNQASDSSLGDIVMKRFSGDVSGQDQLVNTITAGNQEKPALGMNGKGTVVVSWASLTNFDTSYDIKARRYVAGAAVGPEFLVNATRPGAQTEPDVAVDSEGNFIVVWDSWEQDGGDRGVYGRLFGVDGAPRTGEFLINTTTAYSQARPAVRYLPDGRFVVVWESWKQDQAVPAGYGVYGRLFDANASAVGGEFQVNAFVRNNQWFADVETFSDNSFAVVWCSWEQDGAEGGIVLQKFGSNGQKVGNEILINQTSAYYQWLPRIRRFDDNSFVVIWSSWKQDGSREGVYVRKYGPGATRPSFETQLNTFTSSYQWEPDCVPTGINEILAVWSSWGQTGKDYDIVARKVTLLPTPQGYFSPASYGHPSGNSTTHMRAYVVDSLALTGHSYEVVLDSLGGRKARLNVQDLTSRDTVVAAYPIDRGEGVFYVTPRFHGVVLEVIPEFDLDLDFARSYMINRSGTTIPFAVGYPSAGVRRIAPVDIALIWGSMDTLSNGTYATPLDTAKGALAGTTVVTPFRAWNMTDNERTGLVVAEGTFTKNSRWDPGEKIIFLTPPRYAATGTNTHAELTSPLPTGAYVGPGRGDTNVVLTTRPIRQGERFSFTTSRSAVLDVAGRAQDEPSFLLNQNYPNPFNPSTTISYTLSRAGRIELDVVNLLGQRVAILVEGEQPAGRHRVPFDGAGLASGVYFTRLTAAGKTLVQKMMIVR